MSNVEELLTAMINSGDVSNWECKSRIEEYLKNICLGESCEHMAPQSRIEYLLKVLSEKGIPGGSESDEPTYNGPTGEYNIEQIIDGDECELVITTADGGILMIEMPEEIKSVAKTGLTANNFDVTNNIILFFFGNDVWRYKKSNKDWKYLYKTNTAYSYFQTVKDGCVMGCSAGGSPLLLYDLKAESITPIYDIGRMLDYYPVNSGLIMSSDADMGLIYYSDETKTAKKIWEEGKRWSTNDSKKFENGMLFTTSYSDEGSLGIILYRDSDRSVKKVYNEGYSYSQSAVCDRFCILNSSNHGVVVFDNETEEVYKVLSDSWYHTLGSSKDVFISNNSSSKPGLLIYNNDTKTMDEIYATGYAYNKIHKLGDDAAITANEGLLFYKHKDKTVTKVSGTSNWSYAIYFKDDAILSRAGSVVIYNGSTGEITSLSVGSSVEFSKMYQLDDDNILLYGVRGTAKYTYSTKNIEFLDKGYGYGTPYELNDNVIIFGNGSDVYSGVKKYDKATNKVTSVFSSGKYFNVFELKEDGLYIYSTSADNKLILRYDFENDKCYVIGYRR